MESPIYGVLTYSEGTHTDVSMTLRGAKRFATLNGYNTVTKRIGYNAFKVAEKVDCKWVEIKD